MRSVAARVKRSFVLFRAGGRTRDRPGTRGHREVPEMQPEPDLSLRKAKATLLCYNIFVGMLSYLLNVRKYSQPTYL